MTGGRDTFGSAPSGSPRYRGRFAPSPSGFLHLGNARTALYAWLRCRAAGGEFALRVEDLDGPRTRPEAVFGNLEELRWLGLDWDEGPDVGGPHAPYLQSRRGELYQAALDRLSAGGHLFECYLSRKDLAEVASAPHGSSLTGGPSESSGGAGPGSTGSSYGPAERALNASVAADKAVAGKTPSLRFAVPDVDLAFEDALFGPQSVPAGAIGDFVVRRADGQWAYQLAVVVDDAAMGITEVVRGADLLEATAAQVLLYRALDLRPPTFAHLPLLLDESGQRLAKRMGSLTLRELARAGVRAERVVGWLAHSLGLTSDLSEVAAAELLGAPLTRVSERASRLDDAATRWLLAGSGSRA